MDESTSNLTRKLRGYPDSFGDQELEELRDLIDETLTGREFFDYPAGKHIVEYQKVVEIDEAGKVNVRFNRADRGVTLLAQCLAQNEERLIRQNTVHVREQETREQMRERYGRAALNLDAAPDIASVQRIEREE